MSGALVIAVVMVFMAAVSIYMVGSIFRGYSDEKKKSPHVRLMKHFGLSIGFATLFFLSWAGQAAVQWQEHVDESQAHGQPAEVGDYLAKFSNATLENWQSEFLQLFSFVVMSALLVHKGSAESKDSDARIEAKLDEIQKALKVTHEPTEEGAEK